MKNLSEKGFTLVEMIVIAPIVILAIGTFIALLVNLTGEILSSRGNNTITYNLQSALNKIESDIKLSAGFLASNNIPLTASNPQGRGAVNSTTPFTNIGGPDGPALVLNSLVTDGNPLSIESRLIYLADKPNSCSDPTVYTKNTPMTMNIVYFIKDNTLWRRTIMPTNYTTTSEYCGTKTPWQQPSCLAETSRHSFCVANDERIMDDVKPSDFSISYFTSAGSATPVTAATNTDLQPVTTALVSITSAANIAGREISGSGSLRVSRLDTNASSVGIVTPPTAAPSSPNISASVSNGHVVTFTWQRVDTASSYDLDYRINGGAWIPAAQADNNSRSFSTSDATHTDSVEVRIRANNVVGSSSYSTRAITIPLWASLILKNNWTDYGNVHTSAAYTKTKAGVVVLKGLVKSGTDVIASLPEDYAPQTVIMFATTANQTTARLDIRANGDVHPAVGSNAWFSLDGVAFMPAGTTYTNFAYLNGWSTWDPPNWSNASYFVDSTGRVHLRGLIRGGTTGAEVPAVTVPASIRTSEYTHWVQIDNNGLKHISNLAASSAIATKSASGQFQSFNAIYYPSSARADGTNCTTQWCTLPLQNGWVHYGGAYSTPRFTKGSDGIVKIKGLIRAGTVGTTMATLPAGFCPKEQPILTVVSADVWGRIDIIRQSNGTCFVSGSAVSNAWVSLDSVQYIAE